MLPYLKNRDDGVGQGPVDKIERTPDDSDSLDMLDAVASDLLSAIEKKDKRALKDVLAAFVEHIQSVDEQQDQTMMGD